MERKDSLYREYNFAEAWVSQPPLSSRRATRLLPSNVRYWGESGHSRRGTLFEFRPSVTDPSHSEVVFSV